MTPLCSEADSVAPRRCAVVHQKRMQTERMPGYPPLKAHKININQDGSVYLITAEHISTPAFILFLYVGPKTVLVASPQPEQVKVM